MVDIKNKNMINFLYEGVKMELIASGAQADVYKKDNMAIKLFKKKINKGTVEYEVRLQKMTFELDLPVPKIYDIIEMDNKYGIY
jgi:hypothetical protein